MIELIYYPIHIPPNNQYIIRRKIATQNIPNIKNILKKFDAKGIARWIDDKWGGRIIENYKINGKLENNIKY